jgi:hypothetical protein
MAPIETIHIENTLATEDDPHKAALEDNPERAQRPTGRTLLAIFLCLSLLPSSRFL